MRLMVHKAAGLLLWALFLFSLFEGRAEAGTIYTSPYVSFSPDGRAWTTQAGDVDYAWYETGTAVNTGITSSIRALEQGEHYYSYGRSGMIPVGEWRVAHRTGMCIHNDYPRGEAIWHGVRFGKSKCMRYYYSGWLSYCADCGDRLLPNLVYMGRAAAASIRYLEAGTGMDYYYLCPWCSNLEMGSGSPPHRCKRISWNRYKVHYDANTTEIYGGYMPDSIHMYNDAEMYDGEAVVPLKNLNPNAYSRIGYEFAGWNTMPDGSGISYGDGARIRNLTDVNYTMGSVESAGVVVLYAMWRPSVSTLRLDLSGGSYNGQKDGVTVERRYGEVYQVENDKVDAPAGCTVFFRGEGAEAISPITAKQHLAFWKMETPFSGRFQGGEYSFFAPDGNEDVLTAHYEPDAVELPMPHRAGKSFGGWYYEPAFQNRAGGAGDLLIPRKDVTLYAQWVELQLSSYENYEACGKRGSVDLHWSQQDGKDKVYRVYQSRDGVNYDQIYGAEDIGNHNGIRETFSGAGGSGNFTAPYTGIYRLAAEGAAGGDYGANRGGKGGRVEAKVWLEAEETVSYSIGGKDGRGGGGLGSSFANGGGRTVVSSNQKDILLIAGGGGGASSFGNGESGGSALSLRDDGASAGADGTAGGGAGYVGGNAGEFRRHFHSEECYLRTDVNILAEYADYYGSKRHEDEDGCVDERTYGSQARWIPTHGAAFLDIELLHAMPNGCHYDPGVSYLAVYNQNGQVLFHRGGGYNNYFVTDAANGEFDDDDNWYYTDYYLAWGVKNGMYSSITWDTSGRVIQRHVIHDFTPASGGNDRALENARQLARVHGWGMTASMRGSRFWAESARAFVERVTIPPGTAGIYVVSRRVASGWGTNAFAKLQLGGIRKRICGYEEGAIVSAKPAYGGSNYVNPQYCTDGSLEGGICEGDGKVEMASEQIGFLPETKLEGVLAPDLAAPDAVSPEGIVREALGESQIRISWEQPADYGTGYYHMAESYAVGTADALCRSNITYQVITTGVRGYYYLADSVPFTDITEQNGIFSPKAQADVALGEAVRYFHIAAVDVAGNVSRTAHIPLNPAEDAIRWKLHTQKLRLEEGSHVYPAGRQDVYYIKSDGKTPFALEYAAYMDGWPREDYWLKYAVFEESSPGGEAKNILAYARNASVEDTAYFVQENPLLTVYPSAAVTWEREGKKRVASQKFTLGAGANGREIAVIPRAGADYRGGIAYSELDADRENGLVLIGDGEAPVIRGAEDMNLPELLERNRGRVLLEFKAEDGLSGVADFTVKIANQDNWMEKTYTPDAEGWIRVDITADDPIFSGDFTVTAWAVDHVGNERSVSFGTTEFALKAEVKRILAPHDPVFACGESGVLEISLWGYAQRLEVEFPEELLAANPALNRTYSYEDLPQYCRTERLQFMVPLYVPANSNLPITVRAYKMGRKLEDYPAISVIGVQGSVLGQIRTRLR